MTRRKSTFRNPKEVKDVHFHPSRPRWVIFCTMDGKVKIIEYKLNKVMKEFKVSDTVSVLNSDSFSDEI